MGIEVTLVYAASDVAAAESVEHDHADVAVVRQAHDVRRPPRPRARGAAPVSRLRTRRVAVSRGDDAVHQAVSNFNAAAATTTWLQLDQTIQHTYWVRPLFTAPSLIEWSNVMVGVSASLSVAGLP